MLASILAIQLQPRVAPQKLSDSDVQGEYYAKAPGAVKRPAVILLHGSEGSITFTRFSAEGIAWEGLPCLALNWFGGKGQPKNLVEVPLEVVQRAVDWIGKQPGVDREKIYLIGISRGAEAVLSYAPLDRRVKRVVAIAPSAIRFQGFIDYSTPCTEGAFTWKGTALPHVTIDFSASKSAVQQYDDAAKNPKNELAWSQIEKINGPVMFVSGDQDLVWPSSLLASAADQRLKAKNFKHTVRWERYSNAGHLLLTPPGSFKKGTPGPTNYGGTKNGVAFALLDVWPRMMKFLSE